MQESHIARLAAAGVLAAAVLVGLGIRSLGVAGRHAAAAPVPAHVAMVIMPGVRLGPDNRMHDAFTPADITAVAGQEVIVTVYNYDTGTHSVHAPALHLNVLIPGARHAGAPAVRTFMFTAATPGEYSWRCMQPCDDDAMGWAMLHQGYMAGTITITRA
jgi:plastocyanin